MTGQTGFAEIQQALARQSEASSDFDLNADIKLAPGRVLRPAAVLIALIERSDGLHVILTKRSSAMKHHPGQVACPGGKIDPTDANVRAAALREAQEEIALDPENVEVLGELPRHETVTSFSITPVLGRVRAEFKPFAEPGEVAEVFSVPFAHVADPAKYQVQSRRWRGQRRYYYAVPYGPYYIWGATARILRGLADRLS